MRHSFAFVLALLALLPAPAHAGDGFSLQLFRPALDSKGFVTVNATPVLGHLDFSVGLVSSYARHVLDLRRDGSPNRYAVEDLLTPQLQAAVGLFGWLELGLSLPVHILSGSRAPAFVDPAGDPNRDRDLSFSAQSLGDLGLHAKARLVDDVHHPIGLGASVSLYTPTGTSAQLLGEGQVTVRPALLVDAILGRARRVRLGIDAGALVRPAKHAFTDRGVILDGVADVGGGGAFCQPAAPGLFPAPDDPRCGTQQTRALGTQLTYGVALSFAVVPQRLELIGEAFGAVELTGETNGHPLEGLVAAKVYLAAKSYFELGGGAGLLPRTVAGGMTGAPELRVFVGFLFEPSIHGRDGDGDGLEDRADRCPSEPGPADNRGCPLPDSDDDGLLDRDDECPHEPGPADDHGCPPLTVSRLRGGKIVILEPIHFETAKAIIKPESFGTLDAVATTMRQNPQLLIVEIQGHADERGDDGYNLRLTEERAAAVRAYLVEHGVSPERLVSHGYGETRPVCPQHDEDCWSRNRRVEFVIRLRTP
jgi:outer membrane protein OmpA-like peptidoglycan-associated protein